MGDVLNFIGWNYKPPTETALRSRKSFHACQKLQTESIEEWFRRIKKCIDDCEFGAYNEFMLIDKFISGLSETIFERLIQNDFLTPEQTLSIAIQSQTYFPNTIFLETKYEPLNDINEFLSVNIKTEIVSYHFIDQTKIIIIHMKNFCLNDFL